MGHTQGVNMHCTTLILVAVLIAPACSTSVTYPQYQEYTAAGCSSTTLVKEEFELRAGTQMGSCNKASVATATQLPGKEAPSNAWTKVTCTADTATNGYTYGTYTDSECTTLLGDGRGGEDKKLEGTGSDLCNDDGPNKFQKYSCGSTSADVGAVDYSFHSAAGCADSDLTGIGFLLVNKCEQKSEDGVRHSEKRVIENGKIQAYKWTNSANLLDCSGTGAIWYPLSVDTCQAFGSFGWIKVGTMIDGASIAGYSTLGATPTPAPTSATTSAPTTVETVSQAVTISELASSDYTGNLKTNYEKGYGEAVGACSSSSCTSYNTGISIASSATDRRAATVTFVMTLTGVSDTSAYTGGCSGTCTSTILAAKIATATGTTITVSTLATASVTTGTTGNTATSAAISVFLGVVCTVLNLMFC